MEYLLLAAILAPLLGGAALFVRPARTRRGRNAWVLCLCLAVSLVVALLLVWRSATGCTVAVTLLPLLSDGTGLALRLDGLGSVFAAIVAVLWPITDLYAFEYMSHEHNENRFFAFFTMTYGVVLGIAFSANLITLYFFYELLTLCTLPIVMHEMDGKALYAGKKYLMYSMSGAAMAFISMMLLHSFGSLEFVFGGSVGDGGAAPQFLRMAFLLGFFGFGVKAAIFPFHGWLPSAGVAPTPVTALLHAVAVVNAGLFAVLRLLYYGYGTELLQGSWAQAVMLAFAAFTIVFGSLMALRMQHLKRRLAYSTVSNLSYVLLGAALCTPAGLTAALCHMVVHSVLKITLFFCAGALLTQTEELPCGVQEYVFQYKGYARRMPFVFTVFGVASLGLIGIPPFAGFFSKWQLASAAAATGTPWALAGCFALILSAFLTGLYQVGVLTAGLFPEKGATKANRETLAAVHDPGLCMKLALGLAVALSIALIFGMNGLLSALAQVAGGLA